MNAEELLDRIWIMDKAMWIMAVGLIVSVTLTVWFGYDLYLAQVREEEKNAALLRKRRYLVWAVIHLLPAGIEDHHALVDVMDRLHCSDDFARGLIEEAVKIAPNLVVHTDKGLHFYG